MMRGKTGNYSTTSHLSLIPAAFLLPCLLKSDDEASPLCWRYPSKLLSDAASKALPEPGRVLPEPGYVLPEPGAVLAAVA